MSNVVDEKIVELFAFKIAATVLKINTNEMELQFRKSNLQIS